MRIRSGVVLFCMLASVLALGSAASAGGSCAGTSDGGDWTQYGHDLSNTRMQPDEHGIDAMHALMMGPAFVVSSSKIGGGSFNSTPVIAGGCLYAATDLGNVVAVNADTGELVWHNTYPVSSTRLGGTITGAVSVSGDLAYVAVSDAGAPFIEAVNRFTGTPVWRTIVDDRTGSFINSSPVIFNGMLFTGIAGDEYQPEARGGYAILDAATGEMKAKHYVIPDADFANGYWGGSIWSTGAVDAANGYLYVGTGNPSSHQKQHRNTDALVKIDVDPSREATFGQIVDIYRGVVEQYVPGANHQPVCDAAPDVTYGDAWSATCVQFDVDFGASPSLFHDADGNLLVGDLQKSGVYHAVYADKMELAWTSLVGTPCFACNASSPATDGSNVYTVATEPGQLASVTNAGNLRWVTPVADVFHYQSVSLANGLAYMADLFGTLNVVDAATGLPVAKKSLTQDSGESVNGVSSGGVAIARHTVYVAGSGVIVAYR